MDEFEKLKMQAELARMGKAASAYAPLFKHIFKDPDACLAAMIAIGEQIKHVSKTSNERRLLLRFLGKMLTMQAGENLDAFTNA